MGALLFLVHSTSGEKGTILKREYYWYVGLINRLRFYSGSSLVVIFYLANIFRKLVS
jgi:hypothetical protein